MSSEYLNRLENLLFSTMFDSENEPTRFFTNWQGLGRGGSLFEAFFLSFFLSFYSAWSHENIW